MLPIYIKDVKGANFKLKYLGMLMKAKALLNKSSKIVLLFYVVFTGDRSPMNSLNFTHNSHCK
jgi:hypothetical protein